MRPQSLASPSSPGADALSAWITSASPRRLLLIEDGSAGGGSPLAAWLANMRRSDTWEVVHISLGSTTNLFLERDILVALYRALFPDDHDAPATFSLAQLREHVSDGLSTSDEDRDRLVVIERANWGEDRFGQNIGYLLGRIDADQPVVVSLRVDGDLHPPISAWYEHLGWSASDTALLRLAAMPDGAGTPVEQARRDISSCRGSAGLVELLDLLAACLRPMSWASSGDLLGFEADVDRAWSVARRALVNDASNTQTSRRAPLVALFRCVQVSGSVMIRVRQAGSTAGPRAHALVALSNLLPDPARTSAREAAIDVLLGAEPTVSDLDLLVQLAASCDEARRSMIVRHVLTAYRKQRSDGGNAVWILRAAPLLSGVERQALVEEALTGLRELPDDDAWALRDALRLAPDLALDLDRIPLSLPARDRLRLDCALAQYLTGEARHHKVSAVLATAEEHPFPLDSEDLRAVIAALDSSEMIRLFRALKRAGYDDSLLGLCVRGLCAAGRVEDAMSLTGTDWRVLPFDWILALASSMHPPSPDLLGELARRLEDMDATRLGWTIEHDVSDLVAVLGADHIVRTAGVIPAGEERIIARLALLPFVPDAEKRRLLGEAVAAYRAPTGQEALYWRELLSCWEWMSDRDACDLLARGARDLDALWALKDFAPLLVRLAGKETPGIIAEQIIEIGRWMR